MRRLLPLALLLVACGPTGGSENTISDKGAAGPAASDPQTPKPTSVPTPPAKVDPSDNPNRVYQLRSLKKVDLSIKGHTVHAWMMDDEDKQSEGMMFLKDPDVKADEGMLFAFPQTQKPTPGFWMHNTLIPLDIVYLSPQGRVLNVAHGKVQDDTSLPAKGEFKNVIELKAGTADRFGLKPGDTVAIPKL